MLRYMEWRKMVIGGKGTLVGCSSLHTKGILVDVSIEYISRYKHIYISTFIYIYVYVYRSI